LANPPYRIERLAVIMTPDRNDPSEEWGVLNPACARSRDGELYLFPRLVAKENLSRVGRGRVIFDHGSPMGVERLGIALEPDEVWEHNARTGGVEDPRITWIRGLEAYLMTYAAYGPLGPRIGLAASNDLLSWRRLGPASFDYDPGLKTDLNLYSNKDALLFPETVAAPDGTPSYAMLHRPTWDLSWIAPGEGELPPAGVGDPRGAIWVSFAPAEEVEANLNRLTRYGQHRVVAMPEQPWEELKIGGGTPPVRTKDGWLLVYHGVAGKLVPGRDHQPEVVYSAGLMLLDIDDVTRVVARSTTPLLEPSTEGERNGIVPNVVFPTAIDPHGDGSADIFYGMADSRIGAARLFRTG